MKITSKKLAANIQKAINELNAVSLHLMPSDIEIFGLTQSVEDYLQNFTSIKSITVQFRAEDIVKKLAVTDKLFVFRILQNMLIILFKEKTPMAVEINLQGKEGKLHINLKHNNPAFSFKNTSKEFLDITYRLEYYGGMIEEIADDGKSSFILLLPVALP